MPITESTADVCFDKKYSDMNVSSTVSIAGFAISFVVNVVLGVIVGYKWKRLSKSVTVGLCSLQAFLLPIKSLLN